MWGGSKQGRRGGGGGRGSRGVGVEKGGSKEEEGNISMYESTFGRCLVSADGESSQSIDRNWKRKG